jgi:hypothetical protein
LNAMVGNVFRRQLANHSDSSELDSSTYGIYTWVVLSRA